jgi:hypothetical protein
MKKLYIYQKVNLRNFKNKKPKANVVVFFLEN